MTQPAQQPQSVGRRTATSAVRTHSQWPMRAAGRSWAPSARPAQTATRTAAAPAGSRLPAHWLLLVAAAMLAGLMFRETSALVGDPMIGAMLTLILAIPFACAFGRSPANRRRRE